MASNICKQYNKLVRDRIPEIIESKGDSCKTRILCQKEYTSELDRKLNEELAEHQESKSLEELADMLEVMMAITKARGYDWSAVIELQEKKREERGGFDRKVFLEETATPCIEQD